jgi:hypothetical protein
MVSCEVILNLDSKVVVSRTKRRLAERARATEDRLVRLRCARKKEAQRLDTRAGDCVMNRLK